jgi:hypothetical protein
MICVGEVCPFLYDSFFRWFDLCRIYEIHHISSLLLNAHVQEGTNHLHTRMQVIVTIHYMQHLCYIVQDYMQRLRFLVSLTIH